MPLPQRLFEKWAADEEPCTPEECRQVLAHFFAREALSRGLDTMMRKGTYEEAGRRLFGEFWDRALADAVLPNVQDLTECDGEYTVNEIAQGLEMLTATTFSNAVRKVLIERVIDGAPGWLRAPPRKCPVTGVQVKQVWRRTA